jgi:hypothetical protein
VRRNIRLGVVVSVGIDVILSKRLGMARDDLKTMETLALSRPKMPIMAENYFRLRHCFKAGTMYERIVEEASEMP